MGLGCRIWWHGASLRAVEGAMRGGIASGRTGGFDIGAAGAALRHDVQHHRRIEGTAAAGVLSQLRRSRRGSGGTQWSPPSPAHGEHDVERGAVGVWQSGINAVEGAYLRASCCGCGCVGALATRCIFSVPLIDLVAFLVGVAPLVQRPFELHIARLGRKDARLMHSPALITT